MSTKKVRKVKNLEKPRQEFTLKQDFRPRTPHQHDICRSVEDNVITIVNGTAGSGKTCASAGIAARYLTTGKVDKIIISRPVVEAGERLGALPGDADEKLRPYLQPLYDELSLFFSYSDIGFLKTRGLLEICPLAFARGRSFNNAFIILDEAQNATYEQLKMFFTRIGRGSKVIVNGDVSQSDLPARHRDGFQICIDRLKNTEGLNIIHMDASDIQRDPIIGIIVEKLR